MYVWLSIGMYACVSLFVIVCVCLCICERFRHRDVVLRTLLNLIECNKCEMILFESFNGFEDIIFVLSHH